VSLYIYTQGFALGYHISGFQPFFIQTWSAIIGRLDARYLVAGVVIENLRQVTGNILDVVDIVGVELAFTV
jgi:hypothetical protein